MRDIKVDQTKHYSNLLKAHKIFIKIVGNFMMHNYKGIQKEKIKVTSYPISLPSWTNKVAKDNFLLVGEAGNFVDPLSGEGIFWGTKSGKLSANFLKNVIGKGKSCEEFNKIAQKHIFNYLRILFLISAFFYRIPSFSLDWIKKSNRAKQYFIKMLQGKLTKGRLFNFLLKVAHTQI